MNILLSRILLVGAVLTAAVAGRFTPVVGSLPAKPYVPLREQSIHMRGCLDPDARGRSPDVDVLRVSVEHETPLLVTMHGRDGLQPGFIVTADQGLAAASGWMRELGSHGDEGFATTVVLPAAGDYTFVIADRRELTGDEMAAGQGCFTADFQPAAPPVLVRMPYVWRGTVGSPIAFAVPRRGRDFTVVEITHAGGEGILLVSIFEDKAYARSITLVGKESARVLVNSEGGAARILVEEAANWGREPLRAMVRAVPYSIAPDDGDGEPERVVTALDVRGVLP